MKLIFYDEAAKILEVSVDTLAHAVSRGELTKAGLQGNRRQLIEEQVILFTGINPRTGNKKRISLAALSPAERQAWQHYADEASKGYTVTAPVVDEEAIREMVRHELSRQRFEEIQQNATRKEAEALAAREERARFLKANPFLQREAIPA